MIALSVWLSCNTSELCSAKMLNFVPSTLSEFLINTNFITICKIIFATTTCNIGTGSSVGIATGHGLDGHGIVSRWGARFSAPVHTGPGAHPASCAMGTGSFPRDKERPGRDADPSPLLVPWSWKGRAIPLLPLWPVRPVQSLSACTRVHVTLLYL